MIDVFVGDHFVLEADEGLFHVVFGSPLLEDVEFGRFNFSIARVYAGKVDFRLEEHLGGVHWVVRSTFNAQEENTVVELGIGWPNDGAVPLCEGSVITYRDRSNL